MDAETSWEAARRRKWDADHAAYMAQAELDRPIYRALQAEAKAFGTDPEGFNALCSAEIDEGVAANDSREWVRAARVVLDSLHRDEALFICWGWGNPEEAPEPEFDGEEAYRAAQWQRACDYEVRCGR